MTALYASEDFSKFAFVLLIPVAIGVPCALIGALMTLSGLYEERQAICDEKRPAPAKLQIGVLLLILGVTSLAILAGIVFFAR